MIRTIMIMAARARTCHAVPWATPPQSSSYVALRGHVTCEFDLPYIPSLSQQHYFLEAYNKRITQLTQSSALISIFWSMRPCDCPCACVWLWAYRVCVCTCVRDIQVSFAKRDDLRDAHERTLAYVQIVNYDYNYTVLNIGFNGERAYYHVTLRRVSSIIILMKSQYIFR